MDAIYTRPLFPHRQNPDGYGRFDLPTMHCDHRHRRREAELMEAEAEHDCSGVDLKTVFRAPGRKYQSACDETKTAKTIYATCRHKHHLDGSFETVWPPRPLAIATEQNEGALKRAERGKAGRRIADEICALSITQRDAMLEIPYILMSLAGRQVYDSRRDHVKHLGLLLANCAP